MTSDSNNFESFQQGQTGPRESEKSQSTADANKPPSAANGQGKSDDRAFRESIAASDTGQPTGAADPVATLSPSDESGFKPLAVEQIRLEQLINYIVFGVIAIGLAAGSVPLGFLAISQRWLVAALIVGWLVIGIWMIWQAHFWPRISYRHASWRLTPLGIEIRRGVWWKHRISVPISRVQHVDVAQGPIQRIFQLATLTINTAGTQNASIELDGLEYELASQVRDQLIAERESLDVL